MFIYRNLSAIIVALFVVLGLSAANYRGVYAQRIIGPNNSSLILEAPSAPSAPPLPLQLSPQIQNPNNQAQAANSANAPRPLNPTPETPASQASLRNPIFTACTVDPSNSKHSILATYTIEGTVSLGKLQDNPNDVNVTIFNALKTGTLSGKILGPDDKVVSNLNIKRISTTCESSTRSTPLFTPIPANTEAAILAQDNPPTRECELNFHLRSIQ